MWPWKGQQGRGAWAELGAGTGLQGRHGCGFGFEVWVGISPISSLRSACFQLARSALGLGLTTAYGLMDPLSAAPSPPLVGADQLEPLPEEDPLPRSTT